MSDSHKRASIEKLYEVFDDAGIIELVEATNASTVAASYRPRKIRKDRKAHRETIAKMKAEYEASLSAALESYKARKATIDAVFNRNLSKLKSDFDNEPEISAGKNVTVVVPSQMRVAELIAGGIKIRKIA